MWTLEKVDGWTRGNMTGAAGRKQVRWNCLDTAGVTRQTFYGVRGKADAQKFVDRENQK